MKTRNGTRFFTGNFPTGKQDYVFNIPIIRGNFQMERPENVCSINIPTGISRTDFVVNGERPILHLRGALGASGGLRTSLV